MHVYALCHAAATLVLPSGVAQPLQMIQQGDLAAIAEPDLELATLQQDDDRLLHAVLVHDRVIRELFQQTTVLPLRFTAFPTLEDLRSDLQTHESTYLETLTRLVGKAEVTLKFVPKAIPEPGISPELKGKDYFLAKKQQYQAQQQQQTLQTQELQQLLQAIAQQYPISTPADAEHVHILVNQNNIERFQAAIAPLIAQSPQWEFTLSELLPPFHFV